MALECYNKALLILKTKFEGDHLDIAVCCNNIGAIYYRQKDYSKALNYYNKGLSIREKILGLNHPDVAECYSDVGDIYNYQKEYSKASKCYLKAFKIFDTIGNKKKLIELEIKIHNFAKIINRKGDYCLEKKDYNNSIVLYHNIIEIYKEIKLPDLDLANFYNKVARAYYKKGDFPNSLQYCQECLRIYQEKDSNNHAKIAKTYYKIAGLYGKMHSHRNLLVNLYYALSIHTETNQKKIQAINHLFELYMEVSPQDKEIKQMYNILNKKYFE